MTKKKEEKTRTVNTTAMGLEETICHMVGERMIDGKPPGTKHAEALEKMIVAIVLRELGGLNLIQISRSQLKEDMH